jgi:hypothetical protein
VAYQCICARHPGKAVPVCYYLYSLEGALRNQPWDDIGVAIKQNLLRQVSSGKGYATEAHIERGGKIISREILCNESTSRMSWNICTGHQAGIFWQTTWGAALLMKISFVFRRVARHKPGCNGESCTSRNTFDISKKMDLKRLDLRAKQ